MEIFDLYSDNDGVAQERARALQALLRGNQQAAGLASLSASKGFQPFAQMTGGMAKQQGDLLADAAGTRLRMAMQKAEHDEARRARAAERDEDRTWRTEQAQLNRDALMNRQNDRQDNGVDLSPVDPVLAAEIQKTGVNPAAFRNRGEAMKFLLQPRAGQLDLANRKHEYDKGQRDELTPAQQNDIADLTTGLNLVSDIRRAKTAAGVDTGPVSALQNTLAQKMGISDPKVTAFRAKLVNQLAAHILAMSGKASNENEVARLRSVVPEMSDQDDALEAKLQGFEDYLNEKRTTKLDTYQKAGRDTSNFTGGSLGPPLTNPSQPASAAPKRRRWNPQTNSLE